MEHRAVQVDENLLEKVKYPTGSLPVFFDEDYFNDYMNGEFNYHWHDAYEFAIVLRGEIEYYVHQAYDERESKIMREGDVVFVNSRALHMGRQTKPDSLMFCFLFPSYFFNMQPSDTVYQKNILPVIRFPLPGLYFSHDDPSGKMISDEIHRLYRLNPGELGYELQCIEIIYCIWRLLLTEVSKFKEFPEVPKRDRIQEQRARLMLSYVHDHYWEEITVDHIAESANISRRECFRCFKEIVKKTPAEYLCEYRLSKAAQMLTGTDKTIMDICLSCGFNSPSYMGKLFKDKCGMSPGEYRELSGRTSI